MQAIITAYSELDTCHNRICITASGYHPFEYSAACPRKIPLMTHIKIDGQEYICTDRTAKKYDGRYDLWQGYGKQGSIHAKQFGIKKKSVIILK
jgi:hypothetical protein